MRQGVDIGNMLSNRGATYRAPQPHVGRHHRAVLWVAVLCYCAAHIPHSAASQSHGNRGWTAQSNVCDPRRWFLGKGGEGRQTALSRKPLAVWSRHTSRAVTSTRGGSDSGEEKKKEDEEDDPEWLHVTSVADVKSALSDAEAGDADKDGERPTEEGPDMTTDDDANATRTFNISSFNVSDLVFRASKPGDGSESDPDHLPARFLRMHKGNRNHAKEAFASTLKWRKEHDVDTTLSRPHPKFDLCKLIYESYFPGRDPTNNPIIVSRPGMLNLELAHKNNISMDELLMHYVYLLEWCWNILEPGPPDGVMTTVVDMSGVGMKQVYHGEMRSFIQRSVHVISENYPQRSYRTLVINAPRWFGGLFKIIKPLLRESTRKKIEILNAGPRQDVALRKYLGDASLPKVLLSDKGGGGTVKSGVNGESDEPEAGPNSAIEQDFRAFVMRVLEEHGAEMEPI